MSEDVLGLWQANYQQLQILDSDTKRLITISGHETLELFDDGTFVHAYRGQPENEDISVQNTWFLDSVGILHLKNGLWPQLGPAAHRRYRDGNAVYNREIRGQSFILNGEEALLLGQRGTKFSEIYLEHVPTGDPDSPFIIRLTKVE